MGPNLTTNVTSRISIRGIEEDCNDLEGIGKLSRPSRMVRHRIQSNAIDSTVLNNVTLPLINSNRMALEKSPIRRRLPTPPAKRNTVTPPPLPPRDPVAPPVPPRDDLPTVATKEVDTPSSIVKPTLFQRFWNTIATIFKAIHYFFTTFFTKNHGKLKRIRVGSHVIEFDDKKTPQANKDAESKKENALVNESSAIKIEKTPVQDHVESTVAEENLPLITPEIQLEVPVIVAEEDVVQLVDIPTDALVLEVKKSETQEKETSPLIPPPPPPPMPTTSTSVQSLPLKFINQQMHAITDQLERIEEQQKVESPKAEPSIWNVLLDGLQIRRKHFDEDDEDGFALEWEDDAKDTKTVMRYTKGDDKLNIVKTQNPQPNVSLQTTPPEPPKVVAPPPPPMPAAVTSTVVGPPVIKKLLFEAADLEKGGLKLKKVQTNVNQAAAKKDFAPVQFNTAMLDKFRNNRKG